jgi:hypothetical protein
MTISTLYGWSAEHGAFDRVVKMKLEIMGPDELVEQVVDAICSVAHTGSPDDGAHRGDSPRGGSDASDRSWMGRTFRGTARVPVPDRVLSLSW